jgi:limonene-1,2-epoxide hydrolase
MKNIATIRRFIVAWSRLDPVELSEFFTDDGAYHNMPMRPIVGKDNIKDFITVFSDRWTETDWQILNTVEEGNTVFCERVDKTKSTAGDIDLPCFGVFEMENEKIKLWRDYFDLGTYTAAMS